MFNYGRRIFTSPHTNVMHVGLHTRMFGSFIADTDSDDNIASSTTQFTYTQDLQYTSTLTYGCCVLQHLQSVQLDNNAFLHTFLWHTERVKGPTCSIPLTLHISLLNTTVSALTLGQPELLCLQTQHVATKFP